MKPAIKKVFVDAKTRNTETSSSITDAADEEFDDDAKFDAILEELLPIGISKVVLKRFGPQIRQYIRELRVNDEVKIDSSGEDEAVPDSRAEIEAAVENEGMITGDTRLHDPRYGPRPSLAERSDKNLSRSAKFILALTPKSRLGSRLCEFARMNNLFAVKHLLEMGVSADSTYEDGQLTALQCAAINGNKEMVNLLLAKNALVTHQDRTGWTALQAAASSGHSEIVQCLIDQGSHVDTQNSSGYTALHQAALQAYVDVVKVLCNEHAGRNHLSEKEESPLLCAVEGGNIRTVACLLEAGVDFERPNKTGLSPLALASLRGYSDVAKKLVDFGARNDVPDSWGWTPLHHAIQNDRIEIVGYLIKKGADCQRADNHGYTPLHKAASYGSIRALHMLVND